jgi:hypothetical protein
LNVYTCDPVFALAGKVVVAGVSVAPMLQEGLMPVQVAGAGAAVPATLTAVSVVPVTLITVLVTSTCSL